MCMNEHAGPCPWMTPLGPPSTWTSVAVEHCPGRHCAHDAQCKGIVWGSDLNTMPMTHYVRAYPSNGA